MPEDHPTTAARAIFVPSTFIEPNSKPGKVKVTGKSQPELVSDIRLGSSLHWFGYTMFIPIGFDIVSFGRVWS